MNVNDLIALPDDTTVYDNAGDPWIKRTIEREWRGYDAPYPVLVNPDLPDECEDLLDYDPSGQMHTFMAYYGPFTLDRKDIIA